MRYTDDVKLFCKKKQDAEKIYIAVRKWLKERLSLEISPEKSKLTDVRKQSSEFLGFTIKAFKIRKKWIVRTHMTDKAKEKAETSIRNQLIQLQKHPTQENVQKNNRVVVGLHNAYKHATEISKDFNKIGYNLLKCLKTRIRAVTTETGYQSQEYKERYGRWKGKTIYVKEVALYPIPCIKTEIPRLCNQKISNYTKKGRSFLHTNLRELDMELFHSLMEHPLKGSVELNDNRMSLFSAQKGKDGITGKLLLDNMEVHHIIPVSQNGTDYYQNLILINKSVHMLIHVTNKQLIKHYLEEARLSSKALTKLSKYRLLVGNEKIVRER